MLMLLIRVWLKVISFLREISFYYSFFLNVKKTNLPLLNSTVWIFIPAVEVNISFGREEY